MTKTTVIKLGTGNFDQYIGRAGHGQDGYFGNPFNGNDREANITSFKDYFYERLKTDPVFKSRIRALKGKTLACFCKPLPCHGDIIAEYLDNLPEE